MCYKTPFFTLLMISCCVLTACNLVPRSTTSSPNSVANSTETNSVAQCQNELDVLKRLHSADYQQIQQRFDKLLNNAATYSSIRGNIDPQMKGTIDALYKYKTDKLCHEVAQQVMIDLMDKVEKLP